MTRNLLLTGGPYHEFARNARVLAGVLEVDGIESEITDDLEAGLARVSDFDLLTAYFLRWRMQGEFFDDVRDAWAGSLSAAGRDAIVGHLARGRGILALHTATICFDDWPEWADLVGGRWNWARSSHPPPRPVPVRVRTGRHTIVDDVGDFEVVDELYSFLDCGEIDPLMTADRRAEAQPLLWVREVGGGRVVYDALGHDAPSITEPTHATIIRRAAAWAAGDRRVG
jgi:type 1 glutamine amidotransferase